MSQLTTPLNGRPSVVTPASIDGCAQLAIFDGFPDNQPWAQELMARAQVSANTYDLESILELAAQETGAPVGPFIAESYRVARAVGLVTAPERSESAGSTSLTGVAIAQGICCASWRDTTAGRFLVVEFHAPHAVGWGEGRDSLCHEHLKARCLHQYAHQAKSLLEHTEGCETAELLLTEFVGEWGPETENIRRGLATTCILYWSEVATQAAQGANAYPESENMGISKLVQLAG